MSRRDHEIKIGSTTKLLELARDDKGRAVYDVSYIAPDTNQILQFVQSDWRGGHGQYDARKIHRYHSGQSIDTTQEGCIFLGPLITTVQEDDDSALDSAPVCFLWFAETGEFLCATSGKIYRYDVGSSGKWTAATTTVAGVTHMVEYNGVAYAAVGASTMYYYSTDGDTWTQTDLTDGYANRFLVSPNSAGTQNVLWKFKTPNEVTNSTDGRTVAGGGVQWSSPAYIGDDSSDIVNMFLLNDNFVVGKKDNLVHYDSEGGLHYLLNDLRFNLSSNNFKYVAEWQSAMYFSLGDGLGEITSYDSFEPMGPLTDVDDIGKVGVCYGLAADKDWLYVCYKEGSNYVIYKVTERRDDEGELEWRYCPWVFLSTNACATIHVCQHSATDRRLWFGYGTSTGYVTLTDNPLADSNARFAASGYIALSYYEAARLYWSKLWQSVVTYTSGCSATKTITPQYRKDAETSYTGLTAAIITNGTVKTYLTTALNGNRIQFRLNFATNDSTSSPVLKHFEARGILQPERIRVHDCTYLIGTTPSSSAKTMRDFLRAGASATGLIKFADLRYGEKTSDTSYHWAVLATGYPKEVEIVHEDGRLPEQAIQCRFIEVDFTVS